jgi:hypothetical protein
MPQLKTMSRLAAECGVSLPVLQECANGAGVPKKNGGAGLYPAEEQKIKAQVGKWRLEQQQRNAFGDSGVVVLSDHRGESPSRKVTRFECGCCRITVPRAGQEGPPICPHCCDHFEVPGEPEERTTARMRDHAERMLVAFVRAKAAAHEYQEQRDIAFRERDGWREAAIRLVHDHYQDKKGRCVRCGQPFPCRAWKLLEEVNRGYARKAETLLGFSEEEQERHLHPIRRREADYRDDLDDWDEEGNV